MSLCITTESFPSFLSHLPISSVITTLLCFPPVHPMAIPTYDFPSEVNLEVKIQSYL